MSGNQRYVPDSSGSNYTSLRHGTYARRGIHPSAPGQHLWADCDPSGDNPHPDRDP